MTKRVRIENADNSDHKLVVEIWEIGGGLEPNRRVDELFLDIPTAMTEATVWRDGRYLVVREYTPGEQRGGIQPPTTDPESP